MVPEYLTHRYRHIPATSYAEAVRKFYARYGYVPALVFGHPGCGDALESQYVPAGHYACAVREEE